MKINDRDLRLSVGFGSGVFHHVDDEKGVAYFITDRGPNIPIEDAKKIIGLDIEGKSGKIFPVPGFTPTIYKMKVGEKSYSVLEKITLKDKKGKLVTGLTNPNSEVAYDVKGRVLKNDPNGLDTEAIVKLKDGTFWISEEYAPSLVHVDKNGKILTRLVPKGRKKELRNTTLNTQEKLPSILIKRKVNRGIEGLAVSPDEKFLYFIMQSPLNHPTKDSYRSSKIVRLFRMDVENEVVDSEYVYILDNADTFLNDKGLGQSEIKISEMVMLSAEELIVLERAENTT